MASEEVPLPPDLAAARDRLDAAENAAACRCSDGAWCAVILVTLINAVAWCVLVGLFACRR